MPSHPDRVRKFNCKNHDWHLIPGVKKIDSFYFVLNGYKCQKCKTIISSEEFNKLLNNKG
jgi:hypothetical protein